MSDDHVREQSWCETHQKSLFYRPERDDNDNNNQSAPIANVLLVVLFPVSNATGEM